MNKLVVIPASPALARELAPAHAPSAQLRGAARTALADAPVIDIVGSRDDRWKTAHRGSLKAWGAPEVQVGSGEFLPEIMASYLAPHAEVARSRARIGTPRAGVTTVVAVDGSAGLSPAAPLAHLEGAAQAHEWCLACLRGQAPPAPTEAELMASGVCEPALWLELAHLRPAAAEVLAADDSLGVGRFVAVWEVAAHE